MTLTPNRTIILIMNPKRKKLRLAPFKILSLLQFGSYPWLELTPDGSIRFPITKFTQVTYVTRHRFVEHLDWLHERGYLLSSSVDRTHAEVRLATPPNLHAGARKEAEHRELLMTSINSIQSILEALNA